MRCKPKPKPTPKAPPNTDKTVKSIPTKDKLIRIANKINIARPKRDNTTLKDECIFGINNKRASSKALIHNANTTVKATDATPSISLTAKLCFFQQAE